MSCTLKHVEWLVKTDKKLTTADGKTVEVWEFCHEQDEDILSLWAKHFRNHYCCDTEIDIQRSGTSLSRTEYLNNLKFPDSKENPGPSVRSGDFSEILVADFLEFIHKYWVPRTRYDRKINRNESPKGTDIIGFYFETDNEFSAKDKLAIFEAKAQLTGKKCKPRLQDAINDSAKDITRKAESLNAIKQRLYDKDKLSEAKKIERFQCEADLPFKELYGAVALFTDSAFDEKLVSTTVSSSHPNKDNLTMNVIKGKEMMPLVHELYRRAADEA